MSETVSLHIQASELGPDPGRRAVRIHRPDRPLDLLRGPDRRSRPGPGAMRPPPPGERVAPRPGRPPGRGLDRRARGRAGPTALAGRPVPGGRPLVDPATLGCPRPRMGFVPDPDPGGDAPVARSRLGRSQGRGRGGEGTEGPSRTRGDHPPRGRAPNRRRNACRAGKPSASSANAGGGRARRRSDGRSAGERPARASAPVRARRPPASSPRPRPPRPPDRAPPPSETARRLPFDQAGRPPRSEGPPARPDRRAASPQGPPATEPGPASRATGEAPTVGRVPRSGARLLSGSLRSLPSPPGRGCPKGG